MVSAVGQRLLLMFSHVSVLGPILFAWFVGKDIFVMLTFISSALFSTAMHWCDNSASYSLVGDTWCMSLDLNTLYMLDRVIACCEFQIVFLYGPDRRRGPTLWIGDARVVWLTVFAIANGTVVRMYNSETLPVVITGIVLFLAQTTERILTLYLNGDRSSLSRNPLGYFFKHQINYVAFALSLPFGIGAVVAFAYDEGTDYWYLHSIWHFLIYIAAMFAEWGVIGDLPIGYPCIKAKTKAFYDVNWWGSRKADLPMFQHGHEHGHEHSVTEMVPLSVGDSSRDNFDSPSRSISSTPGGIPDRAPEYHVIEMTALTA
jgi:hypothetical protein